MYDSVATLVGYGAPTYDEYGNPVREPVEREVFVQPRSVYQAEFYNAAQAGFKPNLVLSLTNREDYQGEKVLIFEGREYSIIRPDWNAQRDGISLICEEKVRNG